MTLKIETIEDGEEEIAMDQMMRSWTMKNEIVEEIGVQMKIIRKSRGRIQILQLPTRSTQLQG